MSSISRRSALALAGGAILGAAGLSGTASAADGWKRLVVVTANIGRKNLGQRERAIRDVRNAVTIDGRLTKPLVGWQEIRGGDPDNKELTWIDKHFGTRYRNIYMRADSPARQVPMSIPKSYDILERRTTFCHGGKAKVSPSRYITQVLLARVDDPRLRFVFANTHYVSGAWNGKEDPHEAWRDEMWRTHFRKHRDNVLGYWRGRGFPVIWTGDVNRNPMPLLLPNYEKRAFARGIDQIGWVPGDNGTQIRLNRTKTVPMYVDGHDARVAIMQVRRV
ncbi:hypothetical protein FB566_0564 [Stackebrandtia endophytica]|uniref:Endonuclease/exonuclease/phosphatase family protein n=1 Tax=Stackebrandtia endophytica TaxID=1496996 RepID=A0A543AR69_9ACTN|nr:hypothetical protein [Stackebrandtia endophytica]TQL75072.1 hypothetical protein FB566_0564 [Stackebrandtia endophytica]